MTTKRIISITYAETSVANESGEEFPADAGSLFVFPEHYSVIGQRLALFFYENGVKLTEQDKITVVFSTFLDVGAIQDVGRLSNDGSRYVTVGVQASDFNAFSEKEKIGFLLETTEKALHSFDVVGEYHGLISQAVALLKENGEGMTFVYQTKADQKIAVDLSLRLTDSGQCDIYSTIRNGEGEVVRADHLENAHCLSVALQRCGSILIRKNKVIIKPQKNILCKNLKPIEIEYTL